MILETFKVGPVDCNCSILVCPDTSKAIVVDPGGNPDEILERLDKANAKLETMLITHAHFDHVIAARQLKDVTGAKVRLHKKDRWLYRVMPLQYRMSGLKGLKSPPRISGYLKDGENIRAGTLDLSVMHTPGHSPGSCCFHWAGEKILFSGDTLFKESVGNWRFPGGNFEQLVASLEKFRAMPAETRVIPGHNDETTIAWELANSPYFDANHINLLREEDRKRPGKAAILWQMIRGLFGSE